MKLSKNYVIAGKFFSVGEYDEAELSESARRQFTRLGLLGTNESEVEVDSSDPLDDINMTLGARELAVLAGLDPEEVKGIQGTGEGGRIYKQDVQDYLDAWVGDDLADEDEEEAE